MQVSEKIKNAHLKAVKARENAYVNYSDFKVGASIGVKNIAEVYTGCNVENVSFGGTICAERNAVFHSITENGKIEIEYIVIVCDTDPVTAPCGMCLQVISEFATKETCVYLANLKQIEKKFTFAELFPHPFTSYK